jgi:hypothetical protein
VKPGTRVAFARPGTHVAILGKLVQPVLVDDERRWSVEWDDGFQDHTTWPEAWLYEVILS